MTPAAAPALPEVTEFDGTPRPAAQDDETVVARLRRLASEPFLHFALLGALVFVGHRALARPAEVRTLEISGSRQRELAKLFEQRQHRAPTDADRQQLLNRYVEDEVLFREGVRLSLVQTDPMLRAQLIARVRSLLQGEVLGKPPTEDQLHSYYEEHHADFAVPETVTYREFLFPTGPDANDAARRLALSLQRSEEPDASGLPSPTEYVRRSEAELSALQGPDLARRLWTLPTGVWRELSSSRGVHVVRVDEHTSASDPPLSSIREQVLAEYRKAQTAHAFQAEVARLTSQWRVHAEKP
jgi:parvulin-like peptidyl-prolyl isomerase